jgi:hypothetical protein
VIINNLDLVSIGLAPYKTDSPLIVDPDAMLTLAVAAKFLQTVTGRNLQVLYGLRVVQHCELAPRGVLDALKTRAALAVEKRFRVPASERFNHPTSVLRLT